jgi:hypothetical protein
MVEKGTNMLLVPFFLWSSDSLNAIPARIYKSGISSPHDGRTKESFLFIISETKFGRTGLELW